VPGDLASQRPAGRRIYVRHLRWQLMQPCSVRYSTTKGARGRWRARSTVRPLFVPAEHGRHATMKHGRACRVLNARGRDMEAILIAEGLACPLYVWGNVLPTPLVVVSVATSSRRGCFSV
jgi:hypothetical protein